MVREGVMRIGNADLRISSRARFPSELEADDPGDITLQSQHLQVEHQPCMVGVSSRYAHRAIQIRQLVVRAFGLGLLNAALDLADGIQVLADPDAIARSELPL